MARKNEITTTGEFTEIDELFGNKHVALSNALIQAREKTSLLESKIELLAIYRMNDEMKTREREDAHGHKYSVHYVTINSNEIRRLMGRKGGSIYEQMFAASLELKQKLYIYRDKNDSQFKMDNLYGEVEYNNGKMTIEFNPATEYLFLELKDNFTKILLDVAFKFQTNGGFQLYKLLKSFVYPLPEPDMNLPQEDFPVITKEYSLSELRLQLGYVDLNQPEIKLEGQKRNPDAEKMARLEKKPKYKRWGDFYTRVIEPGIEEVNRISDIYIVGIEKQCVAHGKVDGVVIRVQRNKNYYLNDQKNEKTKEKVHTRPAMSEDQKDEFADDIRTLIKADLKIKDLKAIAEAADYDMSKIEKANRILESSGDVDNIVGFLITAIKEDWEEPTEKKDTKGPKSNKFNEFKQNEYDYDEIEKMKRNN